MKTRVPRYHQIAQTLRERILGGPPPPPPPLPPPPVDSAILQLHTFAADLSPRGEDVVTPFLRTSFAPADRRATRERGCRMGQRVFVLERLRLVGGRPMSFQASYVTAALGEELSKANLEVTPLRQALSFKLGIEIATARETVSAVPLEGRAARALGCRPGIPSFRSDRISLAADGTPIVYDRVFIPGDRFRITRQLRYDHAPHGHLHEAAHVARSD